MNPSKAVLIAEFTVLFFACPLLFRLLPWRLSPIPALWVGALYCLGVLRRGSGVDVVRLWNVGPLPHSIGSVLALFAFSALIITAWVWRFRPQLLFTFVRHSPLFWALVMVLYPMLSVYPQGIIYRAFFFERYGPLFPSAAAMIVASGAAFAFSHIIFRNPWSMVLTFAAGLLFAWRYQVTGSLLLTCIEHALYGCFIFTVGLGRLFYHGAGRAAVG